jgi:hypothetical protein
VPLPARTVALSAVQFPLARAARLSKRTLSSDERTFARFWEALDSYPPAKFPYHGAAATGQYHRAFALAADADAHYLALAFAIQLAGMGRSFLANLQQA